MPTAPTTTHLADDLLMVVTRLARRLRRATDDGISPTQRSILTTLERRGPLTHGELAAATAMLLPAVWFLPWPYRAAPVWIVVGLALQRAPGPRRWPQALGWGAVQAGQFAG